jgi:ribose transport system permease protein
VNTTATPALDPDASQARFGRRATRAGSIEDAVTSVFPISLLAVLVGWLAFAQPSTLSFSYVQNVVTLSLVLILIAFGQSVVTMTGGIDLSTPGVLCVVNAIAATEMTDARRTPLFAALLLALGWLPGLVNGLLVVYGRMQPFIVTLAMWFIWGGVAFYVLPGPGGAIDPSLPSALMSKFFGLYGATWLAAAVAIFAILFSRTRLGLSIRAIGSDRTSAQHSGVPVEATEIAAYLISGWFAVLAGVVLSFQSLSGEPTSGNSYVLPMITAVVVGGVSLAGGKGSFVGAIVGALVLAYLTSVTFSFRLQPQWNQIFQGGLLVFSISLTYLMQRAARKYRERSPP